MDEDPLAAIMITDYIHLLEKSGWMVTHLIDCPLPTERFHAQQVAHMQPWSRPTITHNRKQKDRFFVIILWFFP